MGRAYADRFVKTTTRCTEGKLMRDGDVGAEGDRVSAEHQRLRAEYKRLRRRMDRVDRLLRKARQRMYAGASEAELEGYIQRALRILPQVEPWEAPELLGVEFYI
jgi:hypothetical protein